MGEVPATVEDARGFEVGKTTVGAITELAAVASRARFARSLGNLIGAAEASAFKEIRDRKLYRGMPAAVLAGMADIPAENVSGTIETFDEFCHAFGFTRQRVYERIKMLEDLGEEVFGRLSALGVPRSALRLTGKIEGDGRRELMKLARDPSTERDKLVKTIQSLARENGALEKDLESAQGDVADRDEQIEAGKKQLKKISAKQRELKGELADWKAGRAMPEEARAEMQEFAQRCAEVKGVFHRLSTYGWGEDAAAFAGSFGALVLDTALEYFETIADQGLPTLSDRKLKQVKRLAEAGHLAADAVAEE